MSDPKEIKITGAEVKDLAGLAPIGVKIIEAVSGCVGKIYEPIHIRRIAKANADGALIDAESKAATDSIEQRSRHRFETIEIQKQQNLDAVVARSIKIEQPSVSTSEVDFEWMMRFVDNASYATNEEMQELWARILSGEVASPGTFSKRTLNIVQQMDARDAKAFVSLCQFGLHFDDRTAKPVIHDYDLNLIKQEGIIFSVLKHLESIGLISFESLAGYEEPVSLDGKNGIAYQTVHGTLKIKPSHNMISDDKVRLPLGHVMLTSFGHQLSKLVDPVANWKYIQSLVNQYSELGFECIFEKNDGSAITQSN
jgi:Protein of unknown function (DUF2806)